jgi:hypothetical protein
MRNKRANSIRIAVHATGAPLSKREPRSREPFRGAVNGVSVSHGHREALHAPLNRPGGGLGWFDTPSSPKPRYVPWTWATHTSAVQGA